jgi:hypothetical protein
MPAGMDDDVAAWTRALQSRLDQALTTELDGVPVTRITNAGDPGFRITEVAHHQGVDLIMMPTHGRGLFRSLLVGSVKSSFDSKNDQYNRICADLVLLDRELARSGRYARPLSSSALARAT